MPNKRKKKPAAGAGPGQPAGPPSPQLAAQGASKHITPQAPEPGAPQHAVQPITFRRAAQAALVGMTIT
jgi:hypothetical protein